MKNDSLGTFAKRQWGRMGQDVRHYRRRMGETGRQYWRRMDALNRNVYGARRSESDLQEKSEDGSQNDNVIPSD